MARDSSLATTFQMVKLFDVFLKKAVFNVVKCINTWNVVVKQASRAHVMRLVW